jgi:hypothetical protein
VIHTLFARLTTKPCRKYWPGVRVAMMYAQIPKIASQISGSTFEGIRNTVPSCWPARCFVPVEMRVYITVEAADLDSEGCGIARL